MTAPVGSGSYCKQELISVSVKGAEKEESIPHPLTKDLPLSPRRITSGHFAGLPILKESSDRSMLPYLFCNEIDEDKTLDFLRSQKISSTSSVHVGFSLWFNFDVISVTNPKLAIICDIDRCVMEMFQIISSCLSNSTTRRSFVRNFTKKISPYMQQVCNLPTPQSVASFLHLKEKLSRKKSWLSSDRQYRILKKMHEEGRIIFQNLDLTDSSEAFPHIAKWLQDRSLQISTLYASNILEWVSKNSSQKQQQALKNLHTITSDNTFFIQAYVPFCSAEKDGPQQVVAKGPASIKIPKIALKRR
jgi:hypothetical protein